MSFCLRLRNNMVKVENRYILSEGDKSLSLCFVDELSNEKNKCRCNYMYK